MTYQVIARYWQKQKRRANIALCHYIFNNNQLFGMNLNALIYIKTQQDDKLIDYRNSQICKTKASIIYFLV